MLNLRTHIAHFSHLKTGNLCDHSSSVQRRDVVATVVLERTKIHQLRNLSRRKAFNQLLDEFRIAEQFLITGVVIIRHRSFHLGRLPT